MKKQNETGRRRNTCLAAGLTVEAAAVVSLILIAIASLLLMEFRMHDRLAAQLSLSNALEEYSYRNPEERSVEQISQAANSENLFILNAHPSVTLTPGLLTYSISGCAASENEQQNMSTKHVRTEILLRASTAAELANLIGGKNGTGDGTSAGTETGAEENR